MTIHDNSTESRKEEKRSGRSGIFRRKIYEILDQLPEGVSMTDRELMGILEVTDPNLVRPEVTRLKQDGLVWEVKQVKCPVTNRRVRAVATSGLPYAERSARGYKHKRPAPYTFAGDRIKEWLSDNPGKAQTIAYHAIAGLYLEGDGEKVLPEDDCYPRGSGSDYVDEVGGALIRVGIMPLIQKMQAELDEEGGSDHE